MIRSIDFKGRVIIKKHIKIDNKNLLKFMKESEILWLDKHFKFINRLLMGDIKVDQLNLPLCIQFY